MRSDFFITSDGVRLHVAESTAGPIAPEPVVALIPGWSMPVALWAAQFSGIGERYRVVGLDPRGQGRSDVPGTGYTVERRAQDIAEFLQRLPPAVLVGWSLGALEALHYVHAYGDRRLLGLILVDSSVGELPRPPEGRFTESLASDRRKSLEAFVRAIFRTPRTQAQHDELLSGAMRMPLQASIDLLSYPQPREHWRNIARAFAKPLLYVVTPQFAAQAQNLRTHRPETRVEVFEQAGHALFVDEPQRFNMLVQSFVRNL